MGLAGDEKFVDMYNGFDTISECDRQRRTDRQTEFPIHISVSIQTRDKNCSSNASYKPVSV